jgi:hypothetical protein
MTLAQGFACTKCGDHHEDIPLSIGFALPDFANKVPVWEKGLRINSTEDWAIVDEKHHYLRACLEVPVIGSPDKFVFGVWCAIGEEDFYAIMELWETEGREKEEPFDVTIANTIPCYEETLGLAADLHLQKVGDRPLLKVKSSVHPLCVQQIKGMPEKTLLDIATVLIHK